MKKDRRTIPGSMVRLPLIYTFILKGIGLVFSIILPSAAFVKRWILGDINTKMSFLYQKKASCYRMKTKHSPL